MTDKLSKRTGAMTNIWRTMRDYMMYIVLVVIVIFFTVQTRGSFLTAFNINNLINQSGYVATLAIGMTLILIIKHIELSVGYAAGFAGAVAAILLSQYDLNVWLTMLIVLLLGLVIGLYHGTMVAYVGIPAFIITLAGMFIFRGLLSRSLTATGTIIIRNDTFNALSNGFVPDPFNVEGVNMMAVIIGTIILVALIGGQIRSYREDRRMHTAAAPAQFILTLVVVSGAFCYLIYVMATFRGIPWTLIIVAVILSLYNFMLQRTRLGRYIYGIGGNAEATELSGVNVRKVTLFCFASMGVLAALSGILYTSRLQSATPTAGAGFEMDAIASSYIGGVAVSGGVGKVTNTIVGTLVITSLTNGLNLMGIDAAWQYVIKGIIFTLAVAFDILSRRRMQ